MRTLRDGDTASGLVEADHPAAVLVQISARFLDLLRSRLATKL